MKNKTLKELKDLCKKNNFKNYSKLDKNNLIKFIKKNMKGGVNNYNFNGTFNRESLRLSLNINEEELNKLKKIRLNNHTITEIDIKTFDGLNNLTELFIYCNNILTIKPGTFKGLRNLKLLNLMVDKLQEFEQGTFEGLINLETLEKSAELTVDDINHNYNPFHIRKLQQYKFRNT